MAASYPCMQEYWTGDVICIIDFKLLKSTNVTIGCKIDNADKIHVETRESVHKRQEKHYPKKPIHIVLIMLKDCTFEDYYGGYVLQTTLDVRPHLLCVHAVSNVS